VADDGAKVQKEEKKVLIITWQLSIVFLASKMDCPASPGRACIRMVVEECSPERLQEG
jgi:hypothetical protein